MHISRALVVAAMVKSALRMPIPRTRLPSQQGTLSQIKNWFTRSRGAGAAPAPAGNVSKLPNAQAPNAPQQPMTWKDKLQWGGIGLTASSVLGMGGGGGGQPQPQPWMQQQQQQQQSAEMPMWPQQIAQGGYPGMDMDEQQNWYNAGDFGGGGGGGSPMSTEQLGSGIANFANPYTHISQFEPGGYMHNLLSGRS